MAVILKKENAKTKNKNKKQTKKKKKQVGGNPHLFFLRVHKLLFYFYCGMNDNIKPKT